MYKTISKICFTVALFAFIVVGALQNLSLLKSPLENYEESGDFDLLVDEVQGAYLSDDFAGKDFYINLNGLFAKWTGRVQYNNVIRMNNGMLNTPDQTTPNMEKAAEAVADFSEYLKASGIDFTFIQAPSKYDLKEENLPVGITANANQNANDLLFYLEQAHIDTLDLRPLLCGDADAVQKYFYNTDHHWNNDGAFLAYQTILQLLAEKYPEEQIDLSYADKSNWETTLYEDSFLGSQGKRVGVHFGGVDDYLLYTPKFPTDMYVSGMQHNNPIARRGSFEQTCVVKEGHLETEASYFDRFTYSAYIGGDFPIIKHRNLLVDNGPKVLIIKDSFSLPVQAFLSTAISELDVVDPRHLTDMTLAEYTALYQPDIVLMMVNPSVLAVPSYFRFDIDRAEALEEMTEETLLVQKSNSHLIASEENNYAFHVIAHDLAYNAKYVVRVEGLTLLKGEANAVTVALYNEKNRVIYDNLRIDENGVAEWVFCTPKEGDTKLSLLLYAGVFSQTGGNEIRAQRVTISRLVAP